MMCTRPIEQDGNTFACRTCDECISTRRHAWVARAMAEKATHRHAMVIALTYGSATEADRDAARMFAYVDVMAWLKRLRAAMRRLDRSAVLRFLCAGEQGDRNGRCHWHVVVFSSLDVRRCGSFSLPSGPVKDHGQMLTVGKHRRRLRWSLWPHGLVTLQEPDQGAMNYVLSYVLKDQFTIQKSAGTMREAKAENFATGLFRMSKRPAIGERWLMDKLVSLDERHQVLPSLNLTIPEFHGYFRPSGEYLKKLLWGLTAINRRAVWLTGKPAPQWSTLLASCENDPSSLEILNGEAQEEIENRVSIENSIDFRQREKAREVIRAEHRRTCGCYLPCEPCLARLDNWTLKKIGVLREYDDVGACWYVAVPGEVSVEDRQRIEAGSVNPYCCKRGSQISRETFPDSDRPGADG